MNTESGCPLCGGRDAVVVEDGNSFCPWCLYEWEAESSLVLDATVDADTFLYDLTNAFNRAA